MWKEETTRKILAKLPSNTFEDCDAHRSTVTFHIKLLLIFSVLPQFISLNIFLVSILIYVVQLKLCVSQ